MNKLLGYILSIIFLTLSFAQNGAKDPFKSWKDYQKKIDMFSKTGKLSLQSSVGKCLPFFNVRLYKSGNTLLLSKVSRFGLCEAETYWFYYRHDKLVSVNGYYETWTDTVGCIGTSPPSTVKYYLDDKRIVNFKDIKTDVSEAQLFIDIKQLEFEMLETLKSDCLEDR